MKILSYNVNGIRASLSKGMARWLKVVDADMVCLQEIKATEAQADPALFHSLGYEVYWLPAEKKGYSGVAILSKITPDGIMKGCNNPRYDCEGRVLTLDFTDFSLMNVYMPSGSSGSMRQAFKMQWLDHFYPFACAIARDRKNLIISGDFNICHQEIDIHNPKANKRSPGFLPEERMWMSRFLDSGFIDSFRHLNAEPHNYTWWSYRAGARRKNLGWRIDYHMISEAMKCRLKRSTILTQAKHSDHCPILLEV